MSLGTTELNQTGDGLFLTGKNGVKSISITSDKAVEFIQLETKTLARVNSAMGYPAYYPMHPVEIQKPVKAVLMDLDGTTVKSEDFWMWIISLTVASLLDKISFDFEPEDIPHISGHSVSEHLQYCISKYCRGASVEDARIHYYRHTSYHMSEIMAGRGKKGAFTPAKGVKEFLLRLKAENIKIGLVTSGLYEKAYPEILSAFQTMDMGDPKDFYDCIITAGQPLIKGQTGTLGELCPKPHPWLYAEAGRVGLGIPFKERNSVVGIEDSGAGVCSIRLAGYPVIGIADGNIEESGTKKLCAHYCKGFEEITERMF